MKLNAKSLSTKACLLGGAVNLVTLAAFCVYGIMYDYFDTVVLLTFLLGCVCAAGYLILGSRVAELLNLLAVLCVSFGLGLFFLNSYPVWADRLNNITMYASRGTLFPVISIMILCAVTVVLYIVSCFTGKEGKTE